MAFGPQDDPLAHVDSLLEIITRAHLLIFSAHRRLVELGLSHDETAELLSESTEIALERAPEAVRAARAAAQDQALRLLLDPQSPADEAGLAELIGAAESTLTGLLQRQQQIVKDLRARDRSEPQA